VYIAKFLNPMSTPQFLGNSESPKAQRPRSLGERAFLVSDGRLRAYVRVLLFVFCVLAINLVVSGFIGEYFSAASLWWQFFWSSVVLVISFLALSWIFVRFVDHRDFSTLGLTLQPGWGRELGIGFAFGAALQLIVLAILAATHSIHYSAAGGYDFHFWKQAAASLLLFAIAATVEELSFRGYALKWLMWSIGAPAALVLSSILFGAGHLFNPGATFFSTVNTALAGLMLAIPYVRTRSMWMQIGVHWSWNFTLATIVSLPVSGLNFGPHLFITEDSGPHWLTGGTYGPEGGAVVTIVCVAGIAWLLSTRLLKPSPSAQKELQ
jgi:membrane protease YdiL (CAAX protease family)